MKTLIFLALSLGLVLPGCTSEKSETTTRGNLHVLIAESFAPPMIEEVDQFLNVYAVNGAHITYEVVTSDEAIRRLVQDTARFIVSARPLTAAERQRVPTIEEFNLGEVVIAYDGIAAVVHHANPVERITTTELYKVLDGEITRWEQLSQAESMKGKIEVLVQDSSDVSSYIEARLLQGKPFRKDIRWTRSSLETLRDVVERPTSIGFVGVTWIDSARVPAKVLEVAETQNVTDTTYRVAPEAFGKFHSPHPANIYRNYYPLRRAIYMYTLCPVGSLASGFATYVANKEGQRLLLQRNVVPGTQPIRLRAPH
jgi:phosphate transport system substrate-binding protein